MGMHACVREKKSLLQQFIHDYIIGEVVVGNTLLSLHQTLSYGLNRKSNMYAYNTTLTQKEQHIFNAHLKMHTLYMHNDS